MATDWRALAAALDLPVPAQDLDRIAPRLEDLERLFGPLREAIPHSAVPWTEPE